jgi:hypothetical protein
MTRDQFSPSDDDRLAARLRAVDPARGAAPLAEHRIEDIMSTIGRDTSNDTERTTGVTRRGRRRLTVALGVAAVTAAAVVTAGIIGQRTAGDAVALVQPDPGVSAACAPIAPEFIADTDFAFEGRVTRIDGATVTLEVLRQYTGEAAGTVTVPQGTDDLIELTTGPFEMGGTYLVSAVDGVVTTCGSSGPSTPELKAVYEAAFP